MLRIEVNILYYNKNPIGRIELEIDGYYVFYPNPMGFYNEYSLRKIADFLESLNKEWNEKINKEI